MKNLYIQKPGCFSNSSDVEGKKDSERQKGKYQ